MTKIEKLDQKKDKIVLLVTDTNHTYLNAIRRSVSEIPTLAIDEVEFYKNDSALYDEFIAHRLGLVPLKTGKTFTKMSECSCKGKGCLKCSVALKLKVEGPATVCAGDLKGKGTEPILPEIPIVLLSKGQALELSATAILGIGKEHSKFIPGLVWFNPIPEIKGTLKNIDCLKDLPKKAIIKKGNKLEVDPLLIQYLDGTIQLLNEQFNGSLEYEFSGKDFVFSIESFGQYSPKEVFIEALDMMDKNLDDIAKVVKKA